MSELMSIIVPVYNVEAYLPRCINSILAQTCRNFELILVDDGSPDKCGAICDESAARDERVRVVHKENGGLSDARNAGLEVCRGEFVTFVDSDDWLEPEYLQVLMDVLMRHGADIAQCGHNLVHEDGRIKPPALADGEAVYDCAAAMDSLILNHDSTRVNVMTWGKLYRRSIFANLRYLKGRVHEDDIAIWDILNSGCCRKVATVARPLYNYLQRPSGICHVITPKKVVDRYYAWLYVLKSIPADHRDAISAWRSEIVKRVWELFYQTSPDLLPYEQVAASDGTFTCILKEIFGMIPVVHLRQTGVYWKDVWLWQIFRWNFNFGVVLFKWRNWRRNQGR